MMNRTHGIIDFESVDDGSISCRNRGKWSGQDQRNILSYLLRKQFKLIVISRQQKSHFQGLPPEVYALVSNHKVTKELWERIQLLKQGISFTKQEREYASHKELQPSASTGYGFGLHLATDNDGIAVALEAQAACHGNADNPIGNTKPKAIPVIAKKRKLQ
ncbi:hypothetical protein Tco_1384041 [Tanacetum coccineum]